MDEPSRGVSGEAVGATGSQAGQRLCMEAWNGGAHLTQLGPAVSSWCLLAKLECSGGSGWGRLKEALLWAGAAASCGRRKHAFSCPAVWPRQPGQRPQAKISFISRAFRLLSYRFFCCLTLLFLPSSEKKFTRSSEMGLV